MSAPPTAPAAVPTPLSFDDLLNARKPPPEAVRALVEEIAATGPAATVRLSHVLAAEAIEVRVEAARALGQVGDERAIAPLRQVLRRIELSYRTGAGFGILNGATLVVLAILLASDMAHLIRGFPGVCLWLVPLIMMAKDLQRGWSENRALVPATTAALAQLGERVGSGELRPAASELRGVTRNVLLPPAVRSAARALLQQLEEVDALPIPADGGGPQSRDLPVPSAGADARPAKGAP